jgi:hypothetical protein
MNSLPNGSFQGLSGTSKEALPKGDSQAVKSYRKRHYNIRILSAFYKILMIILSHVEHAIFISKI